MFDRVRTARWQQDNEQWHLLILEELLDEATPDTLIRHRVVPQAIAFVYYQLSWFLFAVRPKWSYRLNADFEDHAEHEYAYLVEENPEWLEHRPYDGVFGEDYGRFTTPGRPVPPDRPRRTRPQAGELAADGRARASANRRSARRAPGDHHVSRPAG